MRFIIRNRFLYLLSIGIAIPCLANAAPREMTPAQAGMIEIRNQAPDIEIDIRYAGSANFTGQPVPGYEASKCYLTPSTATALAEAQRIAHREGYGLRVFDCYRPVSAVAHFVAWARNHRIQHTKPEYFPNVDKSTLLGNYIGAVSGHSRGTAVDLTLVRCVRDRCSVVDMGTGFDFFDPRSHTASPDITEEQRVNRSRLVTIMQSAGFQNYAREWWHFSLRSESDDAQRYDFPVR